jgi:hypothetical protein
MLLITNQSRTSFSVEGVAIEFVTHFSTFGHRTHPKDLLGTSSRYPTIA